MTIRNYSKEKRMDERALILDAIKQKKQNAKVDFEFPEPDVLDKWVKRKKRKESFKAKFIDDWTNVDFLNYLDFMLKEFGASRAKENTRRDSDRINLLYDSLVKHLSTEMNNTVLKGFLEWWCSIWAPRLTGSEFHLNLLIQDYQIARFASRYEEAEAQAPKPQETSKLSTIDDDSIYDLGGLSLLLMKRGLVIGYRTLKKKGTSDTLSTDMIQKAVMKFSSAILANVLNVTLKESPYPKSDKVDFISLASSALNRRGLTDYTQISYGAYFKE